MKTTISMLRLLSFIFLFIFICAGCGENMNDGSYQLKLDNTQIKYRLGFSCKYLSVLPNSTGWVNAYIDSNWNNAPLLLYPGYSGLINAKDSLYVDIFSQPGKILLLEYGDSPSIITPASRFSPEPSLSVSVSEGRAVVSNVDIIIVPRSINLNGIKILAGSLAASVGIGGAGVSIIYMGYNNVAATDTYPFAIVGLNGNQLQDSKQIGQFMVPPGRDLIVRGLWNGFGSPGSWIVNYQLI